MSGTATYMGKPYYPWWLDALADDVTGSGAAIEGALQGPDEVRTLVLDAREIYEDQTLGFVGDFGEDGFLEEYTCNIRGVAASAVVTVHRNAEGQARSIVVNHRPRSAVLQFSRLMGEKYAGTPMEKYFPALA